MGAADDQKKALLLGRYELGRMLGKGNFGKVYHAKNLKTNEEVAIKVLDKEKVVKTRLVQQLKREIEVLKRVRHPYIVQLHEVMATKSKIYIVMEYVRGGELFNKVSKGRLQEDVARKYFQQLISAVAFCHARGVYHRDIKPDNLLVDENGDLKVADFGLSAVAEQKQQDGLFHTLCGTPAFAAPDVLARKGYDAGRADLWSCGVVLFVLMAGYPPFRDHQMIGLVRKIYRAEYRCPSWFSPELRRLIRAILEPNPNKRITIPEIMQNSWFKTDFKQTSFYVEDNKFYSYDTVDETGTESPQSELCSDNESETSSSLHGSMPSMPLTRVKGGLSTSASSPSLIETYKYGLGMRRPPSLNAFDIISFSSSFNLSGLFEEQGEETRFVSSAPVSQLMSKLEEIGNEVNFTVRIKDCQVSLEATTGGGEKGPLSILAEVFELTPKLVVVEVKKKSGNAAEYAEFCDKELKPRLSGLLFDGNCDENSESETE
ncbi:hypothetical protein LUZ61_015501 [Rhynchospora tenuis]|uniref:non-specific serine/threonine protein kinase n=1 Tax=Rhynchospora tenuis TaxID=198213 RepID=A0AAD5Z3R1_9POAL|nr:hypothetical protein LUZ61_015501 [Rhynchospora tenuis]